MIHTTILVIRNNYHLDLSGQIALIKKDQDPEEEASEEVRYEEGMRQGVQNIVGSDLTNETMRDCKVYKGGYA